MKKMFFLVAFVLVTSRVSQACPQCRPQVEAGVYNGSFAGNIFVMMLPLAVLLAVGLIVYFYEDAAATIRRKV